MSELRLLWVAADDTTDLRRAVLRAGRDDLPLAAAEDALFLGVYDGDRLVATGNIGAEAPEWRPDERAWRIHGMATDPDYRGRGAGGMILDGLLDHARNEDGRLVWCHARVGARAFYRRHGFQPDGVERFDDVGGEELLEVRYRRG